jgi:hypothetical protein
MRKLRLLAGTIVVLVIAPVLFALPGIEYKQLPMPSDNSPTIKTCVAYRSLGQRCRSCISAYRVDGQPYGTCTTSGYSDNCTCTSGAPSCVTQGACTYSNS